jgi:tetratricopeptide (TPR) repeat protein
VKSLAAQGAFPRGIAESEEAIQIASRGQRLLDLSYAYRAESAVYLAKGDLVRALPVLERGFELSKADDVKISFIFFVTHLGHAHALMGRLDEGIHLLEDAREALTRQASIRLSRSLRLLADAYLRAGRVDVAVAQAERALATARERGEQGEQAHALVVLGEASMHGGSTTVADECLRQALGIAGSLGMRPLVAHCHLGLGRLYRRTEKRQEAKKHLTTATTMYREMGMTYWVEQAEAELK